MQAACTSYQQRGDDDRAVQRLESAALVARNRARLGLLIGYMPRLTVSSLFTMLQILYKCGVCAFLSFKCRLDYGIFANCSLLAAVQSAKGFFGMLKMNARGWRNVYRVNKLSELGVQFVRQIAPVLTCKRGVKLHFERLDGELFAFNGRDTSTGSLCRLHVYNLDQNTHCIEKLELPPARPHKMYSKH